MRLKIPRPGSIINVKGRKRETHMVELTPGNAPPIIPNIILELITNIDLGEKMYCRIINQSMVTSH